jgi:hypothetical protein
MKLQILALGLVLSATLAKADDATLRDAVQVTVDADQKIKSTLETRYPCGTPEADQKYIDRFVPRSKIPLFQSYEVVDMEMKGNFSAINELPARGKGLPGSISYRDRKGKTVTVPVSIGTRGHSKQNICAGFKPLQIQFDQDKATYKSTLFQHVGKNMKMATHCSGFGDHPVDDVNSQLVIREYANYRILEELGFKEFKARLIRMKYKDQGNKPVASGYAFFLEPSSKMAERWGYESGKKKPVEYQGGNSYMSGYNLGRALILATDQGIGHNAFILAKDRKPAAAAFWDLDMTGMTNPRLAATREWGMGAVTFPPSGQSDLGYIQTFVATYPEGKQEAEKFLDQMLSRRNRVRTVINSLPIDKKDFMLQRLDTWFGAINHYRHGTPLPGQMQVPTDVPKGNY